MTADKIAEFKTGRFDLAKQCREERMKPRQQEKVRL